MEVSMDIVIGYAGLTYHIDAESQWVRIEDPELPGCWRDKRPLVECPVEVQKRFHQVRP
jgi:hypothetical protein